VILGWNLIGILKNYLILKINDRIEIIKIIYGADIMFKKGEDYYDYNKILTREELSEKVTELMKEVNQLKKEVSKLKDNKKERI